MKIKIFLTIVLLIIETFVLTFPVQNSVAVNQLKDTFISSTNVQLLSTLIAISPIIVFALILLIWNKELEKIWTNTQNKNE